VVRCGECFLGGSRELAVDSEHRLDELIPLMLIFGGVLAGSTGVAWLDVPVMVVICASALWLLWVEVGRFRAYRARKSALADGPLTVRVAVGELPRGSRSVRELVDQLAAERGDQASVVESDSVWDCGFRRTGANAVELRVPLGAGGPEVTESLHQVGHYLMGHDACMRGRHPAEFTVDSGPQERDARLFARHAPDRLRIKSPSSV